MLYEYAIDPSSLADVGNCQTIFLNFMPEKGRIVAEVPRKWDHEAWQAIKSIPHEQCKPVLKKTLQNHLNKLVKDSLSRNRSNIDWDRNNEKWIKLAERINTTFPFAALFSTTALVDPVRTYALSQLLFDAPASWNAPTECSVLRKASDIVETLMPLLKISKSIQLIDMHLYPGDVRSKNVLIELLRRAPEFNFGQGVKKILIHSSDHRLDLQSSLKQHIEQHLPAGLELEYKLWPKTIEHDRFAITDVGGFILGHGFDECKNGDVQEVFISLIGSQKCRSLRTKFAATPTYTASISKP